MDAEAICEAVTRPTMRFVAVKSAEQQAALSLHRSRNLFVKQRTQLVNMVRGLLAEFGIDIPEGLERALGLARRIHAEDVVPAAPAMAMSMLHLLCGQVLDSHVKLQAIDRMLLTLQRSDYVARRLSTIPGIGPVGATSLIRRAKHSTETADPRLVAWLARKPARVASVPMANKMAHVVWAMMTRSESYQAHHVPALAA